MKPEVLTITAIKEGLAKKKFSATELASIYLENIQEKEKNLHAFIEVTEDLALKQAKEIDAKIARKEPLPPLAGVPCSVKDAILVEGVRCTAGSRILADYVAPYDATVVRRIKRAGAVIVGKTNMDEFGMGGSTENSAFGPTKNPYDPERVAGGSGGGSAAALAAGECVISLGEDTGGSIRLPASFCGVVGLKPTYGAVSRYGVIALASSLDQVGPLARNVQDTEILFSVISGKDLLDSTSVEYSYEMSQIDLNFRDLRIGVPKEYFGEGLDPRINEAIKGAIKKMEEQGAIVEEIALPSTKYSLAVYYVVNMSEASANLARYDGIRYGFSKNTRGTLLDTYLESRGEGFGPEVKRRIILGTFALSAGYYDAYYNKAQKVRALLKKDFTSAFQKVNLIVSPVSPFLPFKIGERIADPLAMYLVDIYTVPVNLAGLPSLALPIGKVDYLPVGLQFIAPHFKESLLFSVGKALEHILTIES